MNITHSMKSPARGASRDVGLSSHQAGKGDSPRNVGPEFGKNLDDAKRDGKGWGIDSARWMEYKGTKKVYGYA